MKICITNGELAKIVHCVLAEKHISIPVKDIADVIFKANDTDKLEFNSFCELFNEVDMIVDIYLFFYR